MKNTQLIRIIIFLSFIVGGLALMVFAKRITAFIAPQNNAVYKAALSPTPDVPVLTKTYKGKTGQFHFKYPDSWILVETAPESAILARDAVDATEDVAVSTNGIKMEIETTTGNSESDISRTIACTDKASECSTLTFNDQPYRVSEMLLNGRREMTYETVKGLQKVKVRVEMGDGTRQKENIKLLTAIVSSFDWRE